MLKFYICSHCGKIVSEVKPGAPVSCCGEPMQLLEAGVVEASAEKHIPVATVENNLVRVNVGSVNHPMSEEHLIEWVAVETDRGALMQYLSANDAPEVVFALAENQKAVAVYAYCNLHGLWKAAL